MSVFGTAGLLALPAVTHAQNYPSKVVKIVVPYPPGAGIDALGRLVADTFTQRWGQQVIVENRAGASGLAGTEFVSRAPADGYTLLVMPLDVAVNPALFDKNRYDPIKNLAPIASLAGSAQVLAVNSAAGIKNFADLAENARSKPGTIAFASCGNGAPGQIMGVLLKQAGVDLLHVPYKGCAPAVTDAMGGQVPLVIGGAGTVGPAIKSGRIKPLAVASPSRDPFFPDTPTLTELGYPSAAITTWFGLFAPAGTPPEIIAKISSELSRAFADPVITGKLRDLTLNPAFVPGAAFQSAMVRDVARFRELLQQAGVKAE